MSRAYCPVSVSNLQVDRPYISRRRHPFNDKRLHATWLSLQARMSLQGSCVINQLSLNDAESTRFYRFLRNPQVSLEELIHMHCEVKTQNLIDRHVLVLGDTSSYNLSAHMGRIQDAERVGVLEDNKTAGFMSHVHLALDSLSEDVLGICDVLLWCRKKRKKKEKKPANHTLAWVDKESYKWAQGIDNASRALEKAALRTFVLDRDADHFELFVKVSQQADNHFVIRSRRDRQIQFEGQQLALSACLGQADCLGNYTLPLPAMDHYSSTHGKRVKREAREALIEVRACSVAVLPPANSPFTGGPPLPLYVVEAREVNLPSDCPDNPVLWSLWTTHPVHTFEQAKEIIRFYVKRWIIEQLFRVSKKKGFDLEASQLETFDAIQRQTIMVLHAAAKVLQLVYARGRFDAQPIEEVFDENERAVLQLLNEQYRGTTKKQQNPYPESKTSWATWILARVGGWKGYESRKPPGPITLKRGLDQFYIFLKAFQMMKPSG